MSVILINPSMLQPNLKNHWYFFVLTNLGLVESLRRDGASVVVIIEVYCIEYKYKSGFSCVKGRVQTKKTVHTIIIFILIFIFFIHFPILTEIFLLNTQKIKVKTETSCKKMFGQIIPIIFFLIGVPHLLRWPHHHPLLLLPPLRLPHRPLPHRSPPPLRPRLPPPLPLQHKNDNNRSSTKKSRPTVLHFPFKVRHRKFNCVEVKAKFRQAAICQIKLYCHIT